VREHIVIQLLLSQVQHAQLLYFRTMSQAYMLYTDRLAVEHALLFNIVYLDTFSYILST